MKQNITNDRTPESRKKDHIALAFESAVSNEEGDRRFYYEPMLARHPSDYSTLPCSFAGFSLKAPLWVSSMTGGTALAMTINQRLAQASERFGLGMGLGSCRYLLQSDDILSDFAVRKYIGSQPLFANLGIAQVETLLVEGKASLINNLINKLEADGLIIHVNPLQEWTQPEGDRFKSPPIDTISRLLDKLDTKIIVKEVGQGMGHHSLKQLMALPLAGIEFGALGGTNFSKLEISRSGDNGYEHLNPIMFLGHTADEMVGYINDILREGEPLLCTEFIVSGGVGNYLDGYYLTNKLQCNAIYGQASQFLKYALISQESLDTYIENQLYGFALAQSYLKIK